MELFLSFVSTLLSAFGTIFKFRKIDLSKSNGPALSTSSKNEVKEQLLKTGLDDDVSSRFKYYLSQLEIGIPHFNLLMLADMLGFKDVSLLRQLERSGTDVPIDLVDNFCERARISKRWLKYGEGEPWEPRRNIVSRDEAWLDYEPLYEAITAFFVRKKRSAEDGRVLLVLRHKNNTWEILQLAVAFRDGLGGTGECQLESFFFFIKRLLFTPGKPSFTGVTLENSEFDVLARGGVYPGYYLDNIRGSDWWWDDFINLELDPSGMDEDFVAARTALETMKPRSSRLQKCFEEAEENIRRNAKLANYF